jgi:predicted TIM-barrel fold metal-dependent hydrolase
VLNGYYVYDADAHVVVSARAWADLPEPLRVRRPRPVEIGDAEGLAGFRTSWFIEGKVTPHPWGPGSQPGNTPRGSLDPETVPGIFQNTDARMTSMSFGGQDLSDTGERMRVMDEMGIDTSVIFPSTLYATFTSDPELEAGLYRAYNRYVGQACRSDPRRLKWGGLLPLRHPREACEALAEMRELGACAALVFSTVGERLLSDPAFTPVFDELTSMGLPLAIHFGGSYPPLWEPSRTMVTGQVLAMTLPVYMAFYAVTAGGLLDRHPSLKVAFLEFGSEWVLYAVPRIDSFIHQARGHGLPRGTGLPSQNVIDYVRSGNIFIACEAEDRVLPQEIELIGEDHLLFASDIPHPEMRENAAAELLERTDLTDVQKRKILCDNAARFYGEP